MKCSSSWTSWGGSDCPQSSLLHWPTPTEGAHLSHMGPPWPECMWPLMTSCWCQLSPVLLRSEPAGPVPPPDPRYSTGGQEDLQTGWGIKLHQHKGLWPLLHWGGSPPPLEQLDQQIRPPLRSWLALGQRWVQRWSCRWWLLGCGVWGSRWVGQSGLWGHQQQTQGRWRLLGRWLRLWMLSLCLIPRRSPLTEHVPHRRRSIQHWDMEGEKEELSYFTIVFPGYTLHHMYIDMTACTGSWNLL